MPFRGEYVWSVLHMFIGLYKFLIYFIVANLSFLYLAKKIYDTIDGVEVEKSYLPQRNVFIDQ